MNIYDRKNQAISSVETWELPKGGQEQFLDGRSAKELGKPWFRSGGVEIPREIRELLRSNVATKNLQFESGYAEHQTSLPRSHRGPRNHDLVLLV